MVSDVWELMALLSFAVVTFIVAGLGLGWFGEWFRVAIAVAIAAALVGYRAAWLAGRDSRR